MIQTISKQVTFDEFIAWYPEQSESRYELHDRTIVEMPKPTGKHSEIAGFLAAELNFVIRQQNLSYFIPKECVIKSDSDRSGYEPDLIVLDRQAITSDPRWERESIITSGNSVKLVIEVVSTNWRTDYGHKLTDYETLGIPEYWIVDYLGLGGKRHIGDPKQPTISVYSLVEDEYQVSQFRGSEVLQSPTLKDLNLTAEQVFSAGIIK
jgi:Uma2 family endonuclease